MEKEEMIWVASVAIGKRMGYEEFNYSDYMYGKEDLTDLVWEYVIECEDIGQIAWKEKYGEYKLYI